MHCLFVVFLLVAGVAGWAQSAKGIVQGHVIYLSTLKTLPTCPYDTSRTYPLSGPKQQRPYGSVLHGWPHCLRQRRSLIYQDESRGGSCKLYVQIEVLSAPPEATWVAHQNASANSLKIAGTITSLNGWKWYRICQDFFSAEIRPGQLALRWGARLHRQPRLPHGAEFSRFPTEAPELEMVSQVAGIIFHGAGEETSCQAGALRNGSLSMDYQIATPWLVETYGSYNGKE